MKQRTQKNMKRRRTPETHHYEQFKKRRRDKVDGSTFDKLLKLLKNLNDKKLLHCDEEDENTLAITYQDLEELGNAEDWYKILFTAKNRSVDGLFKQHNAKSKDIRTHAFLIDREILEENSKELTFENPLIPRDCYAFKNGQRIKSAQCAKERKQKLNVLFADLKEWAEKAEPFTSETSIDSFMKESYRNNKTVPKLDPHHLTYRLFTWILGKQTRPLKRGLAQDKQDKSYIFKDPCDKGFIWIYNAYESGNLIFIPLLECLNKSNPAKYSQRYQTEQLLSRWPIPNASRKTLFRLNISCLESCGIFLTESIYNELKKVPKCPKNLIPGIKELLQKVNVNKSNFNKNYINHILLESLAKSIQERGCFFDQDSYFLSRRAHKEIENNLKTKNIFVKYATKLNVLLRKMKISDVEASKVMERHTSYQGWVFNKKNLDAILKKQEIRTIDAKKIPQIHVVGNRLIRKPSRIKGQKQQQFIQLSKQAANCVPSAEMHIDKQVPLLPLADPVHKAAQLPPDIDGLPLPLTIPSPSDSSRHESVKDIEERLPDPVEFDLSKPEHLARFEQLCKRKIIVCSDDQREKLRVYKEPRLDYPDLGEHNRPYGVIVVDQNGFRKGAKICSYRGPVITTQQANSIDYQFVMQINPDYCVVGQNIASIINHSSSSANVTFVYNKKTKDINVIALRKIYPGESLLVDYGDSNFLQRDKQHLDKDERIKREVFLNSYCNSKNFNMLLQEQHYQRLPWNDSLQQLSHRFYGNCDFDLSGTPLIRAILDGNSVEVKRLLKQDPSLLQHPLIRIEQGGNRQKAAAIQEQNSVYPLALATYLGQSDIILALLRQPRIDPNIRCIQDGHTPVNYALLSPAANKVENLKILLRFGASPVLQSANWEDTPLHECVKNNLFEQAQVIVDSWLSQGYGLLQLVGYINKDNHDYLSLALQYNRLDFLRHFLEKYQDLSNKDKKKTRRTIVDHDMLFYFEEDMTAQAHAALSKSQMETLLNGLEDPQQFLQLIDSYPHAFYPAFVSLAKSLLQINPGVQGYLAEAEGHYARYLDKNSGGSPYDYMRKTVGAYRNAYKLATTALEKQLAEHKLKELEPLEFDLAIRAFFACYCEARLLPELYACDVEFKDLLDKNSERVAENRTYQFIRDVFNAGQLLRQRSDLGDESAKNKLYSLLENPFATLKNNDKAKTAKKRKLDDRDEDDHELKVAPPSRRRLCFFRKTVKPSRCSGKLPAITNMPG